MLVYFKKSANVISLLAMATAFFFALIGCGGGTTGTGGGPGSAIQLSGTLSSQNGIPLAGVSVTGETISTKENLERSSETVVTDQNGKFTVTVDVPPNKSPALIFSAPHVAAAFVLPALPKGTAIVTLELSFNPINSQITAESEEIEDDNGNPVVEAGEQD